MEWVWITVGGVGGVAVLVALLCAIFWMIGSRMPPEHVVSMTLRTGASPDRVWSLISDAAGQVNWAQGVTKVEPVPAPSGVPGREAVRQHMGRNSFILETIESTPPRRLVREIVDCHAVFSGRWTYEIEPAGAGSTIRLTEHGHIKPAIPRAMVKAFGMQKMYLRRHLVSLAKAVSEPNAKPE